MLTWNKEFQEERKKQMTEYLQIGLGFLFVIVLIIICITQ